MSSWTRVYGYIEVEPMGRTQAEKTYILETILSHQPRVTGSEEDMKVVTAIKPGYNSSSSHDELGVRYDSRSLYDSGHQQSEYIVVVTGALRDRSFETTFRELVEWLCRLAKRVDVVKVLVKVRDDYGHEAIINDEKYFGDLFEYPSWCVGYESNKRPNRFEYLMWESDPYSGLPLKLIELDYNDPEVDEELARRSSFERLRCNKRD